MKYILKFTPEIILVIFVLLFIGFKDPYRPWDRVINSDGKGYYAYLPAVFIYHDLQFKFVEQYESQYYPSDKSVYKEFRNQSDSRKVNKYFPGMAIVWFPFFLAGHFFAYLELFPRDGYSLPYQLSIAISALLFLWLGARLLRKLLIKLGSSEKISSFITLAITLGTNLIFFTIVEGSMTHVYSFTLITAFAYTLFQLFHDYKPKWFIRSLLLFVLIFLIRPTNFLVIFLVPVMAGNWENITTIFRTVIRQKKTLLGGLIPALFLLAVPLIFWKAQTGHWIVYSYGTEKLNFLKPNFFGILFSFNRGWFIYTPIALVSMFGLIGLFKQNRFRFYWLFGFLLLFTYVASCWWVWYYASKCGQRIFIDIYVITAILLLYLYQSINKKALKRSLSALIILLIGLNIFQFYQHAKWIYPPSIITGEIFFDSFFSTTKKARVYLPEEGIVGEKNFYNDLEKDNDWMNSNIRDNKISRSGGWSSKIDQKHPYGIGLEVGVESMFTTRNRVISVKGWIYTPKERTESSLIVDFQVGYASKSYNPFLLEEIATIDKWTYIEEAIYVPGDLPAGSTVKIYFYNPSAFIPLYIDDLKIDFISLREEPDYMKIEGVILPVRNQ